jgi:hypothetical protein
MEEPDPSSYHQRNILISALALTAICTQLATLMSVQPGFTGAIENTANLNEKEKARWNEIETTKLVEYLWAHRAEGGDGGTFKATTFHAAAQYIAEFRTSGAVKDFAIEVEHCESVALAVALSITNITTY